MRSGNELYLTNEAKKPVLSAIQRFEKDVAGVEGGNNIPIAFPNDVLKVLLLRRSKENFDAVLKYNNYTFFPTTQLISDNPIGDIIKETVEVLFRGLHEEDRALGLRNTAKETLPENPFYQAALKASDELLKAQILLFYNLADKEDCLFLEKVLGARVLPPLGNYGHFYTVPGKEIDYELLRRSGYRFLHKPYFAMEGYTHDLWKIDPYAKRAVDSAKKGSETISFREFLELFD